MDTDRWPVARCMPPTHVQVLDWVFNRIARGGLGHFSAQRDGARQGVEIFVVFRRLRG
jgi:hypothetical protein